MVFNGLGLFGAIAIMLAAVMDTFNISRAEAVLIQSLTSSVMGIAGKNYLSANINLKPLTYMPYRRF